MNTLNPELERQIEALAALCCGALERNETAVAEKAQPLIEALVRGGYARLSNINLQTRIERKVMDQCREKAIHRREELVGITSGMQSTFKELVRWKTQTPDQPDRPTGTQPANISSATDS